MNIFEFKNSRIGMTLVEMVISLVILGILMTATMGMVISSNNIFISTSKAALDRQVGNSVFNLMNKVLKYSTHLQIYSDEASASSSSYQYIGINTDDGIYDTATESGQLKYKAKDGRLIDHLYDNSFYGGRTVQYSVKKVKDSSKHIELTVRVFREGKQVYQHSAIIKCVNLGLVSIGANSNLIKDLSADGSVNQFLVFDADENFGIGGTDALSEEYNVNDFMNRYNEILYDYTSRLIEVYGDYQGSSTLSYDSPNARICVGGTSASSESIRRIPMNIFASRTTSLYEIIFGSTTASGTINSTNAKNENKVPTEVNNYYKVVDDSFNCSNLRAYYQSKINALLGFTPLEASRQAGWESGSYGDTISKNYYEDGVTSKPVSWQVHSGDPLYGVVATKEELYLGYMLKYCDEDGDGTITKDEYPSFADNFFDSTSIASYLKSTNGNDSENKMVSLCYFKDNVKDIYADLIKQDGEKTKIYTYDGKSGAAYNKSVWYATATVPGNDLEDVGFPDGEERPTASSMPKATGLSNDVTTKFSVDTRAYKDTVGLVDHYGVTSEYYWSYTYSGTTLSDFTISTSDRTYANASNYNKNAKLGKDAAPDIVSELNATQLTSGTYSATNKYWLDFSDTDSVWYIVPFDDMTEGWYYIVDNKVYHFFYLSADKNCNDGNVAVKAVENNAANYKRSKARIAIQLEGKTFYTQNRVTGWAFAQAKYNTQATGNNVTLETYNYALVAHQFTDYALYAVDWNSWFSSEKSGILNKAFTVAADFAFRVIDFIAGTNNAESMNNNITQVNANNAIQSLGNKGQFTVDNIDKDLASYNTAFAVFNTKRNSWYYLPNNSTKISQAWSGFSFTSTKDQPTPIDVEFNGDKSWKNSTAMIYDIDNRKLSASGLLGIDTTKDVLWVPLPTGNTTDVGSNLTTNLSSLVISGTPLSGESTTFNPTTRTYSVEATSDTATITCGAVDTQSTIKISVNGTTISNGGAVTWDKTKTNEVVITVTTTTKKTATTYVVNVTRN